MRGPSRPECRLGVIFSLAVLLLLGASCKKSATGPEDEDLSEFDETSSCEREALPNPSGRTITVKNAAELAAAVEQANAGGQVTIFLEDGTYDLDDMLWVSGQGVAFRGRSGDRDAVVVRGQGMSGGVSHVFNVAGGDFTVADMTVGWVANHAVQVHSSSDRPLIHNVRFVDTGEQMLKVSYVPGESEGSADGVVEWCLFEYSAGVGPQYYIGGIDAHQTSGWTVRNCTFRHIRSPEEDLAEHAIHFWSESRGTLIERNTIIDCDRGIGFGMGDRGHSGGMIRNNFVHTTRDVGIGLENAAGAQVYNNTVFTEGYENSIEYRFGGTSGVVIVNNLASADILSRDGGSGRVESNVTGAQASWFAAAADGDLHLAAAIGSVVDRGQALSQVTLDIDCEARPKGAGYDIGADELR